MPECWFFRHINDIGGKAPSCDEPGFVTAQVFAVAAEAGWPEQRIMFMLLARLAQYQHCLLRRNGVRTNWSIMEDGQATLKGRFESLRNLWTSQHQ